MQYELNLPCTREDLAHLKAGDTVYYTENKTLAELFGQMTGSGSQRSAQPAGQKRG